jgi:hypothetical protein
VTRRPTARPAVGVSNFEVIRRWTAGEVVTAPLLVESLRRVASQIESYGSHNIRTEAHQPYETSTVYDLRVNPCPYATAVGEMFLENLRILGPSARTVDAVDWACTCGEHSIREVVPSGTQRR